MQAVQPLESSKHGYYLQLPLELSWGCLILCCKKPAKEEEGSPEVIAVWSFHHHSYFQLGVAPGGWFSL